mgnify:CR=1 FL=1
MYGMRKGGKKPRPTRSTARDTGSNHTRWCTTSSIVYIVECAGDTLIKSKPSVRCASRRQFGETSVGRLCVGCLGVCGGAVMSPVGRSMPLVSASSTVRIHSSERQRTRDRVWATATNANAIDRMIVLNIWYIVIYLLYQIHTPVVSEHPP